MFKLCGLVYPPKWTSPKKVHGWKVLSLWISVYDKWDNVSNLGAKPELQMMYAGSKTNLVKTLGATKVNMNIMLYVCPVQCKIKISGCVYLKGHMVSNI